MKIVSYKIFFSFILLNTTVFAEATKGLQPHLPRCTSSREALNMLIVKMEKQEEPISYEEVQAVLNYWEKEEGSLKTFPVAIFIRYRLDFLKYCIEQNKEIDLNLYLYISEINFSISRATALYKAFQYGDLTSMKILLENGAKIEEGTIERIPCPDVIKGCKISHWEKKSLQEPIQQNYNKKCRWYSFFSSDCKKAKEMQQLIEKFKKNNQ